MRAVTYPSRIQKELLTFTPAAWSRRGQDGTSVAGKPVTRRRGASGPRLTVLWQIPGNDALTQRILTGQLARREPS
jgi:hypothetical protein